MAMTRFEAPEFRRLLQRIAESGPISEDQILGREGRGADERRRQIKVLLTAELIRRVGHGDIEISQAGLVVLDASSVKQ